MANFRTHLNVGIFVSGGSVLALHRFGLVGDGQTLVLFALGVVGSLLPDIDADASTPVRAFFGVLGITLAFAWTLPLVGQYGVMELAAAWVGLFLAVRYLLFEVFTRYTVHRGIWHSWLAVAFVALITVNLAHWLIKQPAPAAWVCGFMVGLGYLTHLVLDELYSVDLLNRRLKRSFGTALKPFSFDDPISSLAMLGVVTALVWVAPPADFMRVPEAAELIQWADQSVAWLLVRIDWGVEVLRVWLT